MTDGAMFSNAEVLSMVVVLLALAFGGIMFLLGYWEGRDDERIRHGLKPLGKNLSGRKSSRTPGG